MYKRIVVGCDGSEEQADALALAQQLRDPAAGRLILVNVFPLVRALAAPAIALDYVGWLSERAAETLAHAEAAVDPEVPTERQTIASPSSAAGLNDVAEMVGADLIVLGSSEQGRMSDMTGRKTIQRLLHGAPCAVAVASPATSAPFPSSPRILVAYDASPEAEAAVTAAYDIAAATSATVVLCEILEPVVLALAFVGYLDLGEETTVDRAASSELGRAAERAADGVTVESLVLRGSPVFSKLLEAAEGCDLIVSGSRGFGPLHRAIAGSTSSALLRNAKTAVLVTPRVVAEHASERV